MRKKILIMSMTCLGAMTAGAVPVHQDVDSLFDRNTFRQEPTLLPMSPTYLSNVGEAANWGRNWFVEMKGGASAFLGTPMGCGDVFDRTTPALRVGVGKWFTPAIGGRIGFQGFMFKNAEFKSMTYQFIHADFMYNVTSSFRPDRNGIPLWDIIPYIGIGMVRNADWVDNCTCSGGSSGGHPFAFSYGIEARYRLNSRMHLVAEVSGMTTAKNFDGMGTSTRFGDNMLTVSAGLSLTIGRSGWRRVVDAAPYMEENIILKDYIAYMNGEKARMERQLAGEEDAKPVYPKNSYSGLNSLRTRLSMSVANKSSLEDADRDEGDDGGTGTDNFVPDSIAHADQMRIGIGTPVYFFFQLNSDKLVDESQLVNLDDIAQMAREGNLKVRISGAADSATGTRSGNHELGQRRARFIAEALMERGVDESRMEANNFGGIDKYKSNEANRFTIVILSK